MGGDLILMFCLSQWISFQSHCITIVQSLDKNTGQHNSKACTCKLAYDTLPYNHLEAMHANIQRNYREEKPNQTVKQLV